jgi:hypothetical protein
MSRLNHHFLAILPLFSILTMSPMQIESKFPSRSIASEVIAAHPKYEARAAKIDRTKIEIDKDLDLTCFSERGEAFRTRLLQERKDYKVDLVEKDAVAAQKARLQGLVSSLVDLEVDMVALKEKKAWEPNGEEIANTTMAELKTTLESLLQDEIENELAVLKDQIKKDETPVVVVKEEPVIVKVETKEDDKICDLEEKNKVLTQQVEDLLAQQKKIMETMLGMSNMMVQMNQQMQMPQQQYSIPSWLMSGSLVNPQFQYPYNSGPTIIMMGGGSDYGPQMGQQNYQQNGQSGQFQYQQPQQQYIAPYSRPDQFVAGNFGGNNSQFFNFGSGPNNVLPIQTM